MPQNITDFDCQISPDAIFSPSQPMRITAEGERPSAEVLEQINEVFGGVAGGLKFEVSDEQ